MRKVWIALALALLLAGIYWLIPGLRTPAVKTYVISVIQLTSVDSATFAGLVEGLAERDYKEGKNIVFLNDGPAGSIDKLAPMIARHLAHKVDMIFVSSTPAALAVKHATEGKNIPVVFAPVNDPVGSGIVQSIQKPGGNITGIRLPAGDDVRMQWLTKLAPHVKRVLVPYTPGDKSALASLDLARQAAQTLGLALIEREVGNEAALRQLLLSLPAEAEAIFLPRDSSVESHIREIVAAAEQRHLPLCAPSLSQVEAGALLSYGFAHREIGIQAAGLVDQVLRGTPPADLPVETAESHLAINLRTAQAIGLPIPDEILFQAEKVIRQP
ncbi:ABC transporter substrate-binding protein [Sulfurimicrobium lacus]|uniref:ABC transporter substrate-binding protein n=1 Tax=Sulfurimicrobium lacus TaxID=2715678 RepID=A0A6F8VE16_9PROT|nr:ABC transporter substrate-binding protein [Sulfurimicrobium lacus]BCB27958.1 ABC transporter substrate-binding protein [Sulfurimicrobium lacus]